MVRVVGAVAVDAAGRGSLVALLRVAGRAARPQMTADERKIGCRVVETDRVPRLFRMARRASGAEPAAVRVVVTVALRTLV